MSYTFSCKRLLVLVEHGGALVSAPEYQKRLSGKLNLRGDSMLHLNVRLMFYFREQLKMYKNLKKKMNFILHLMIHLTVQWRGPPEGTLEAAPNDSLTNLYEDAKESAFEVALKDALEVALGLHLWLHLLKVTKRIQSTSNLMVHLSMNMSVQLYVLLMIYLKAHLHLRFKLTVAFQLSCT